MDGMIGICSEFKNPNNLNEHLLLSLEPLGVPKTLKNTTHSFTYGNINELHKQ